MQEKRIAPKVITLRITPDLAAKVGAESKKLGVSTNDFMRMLMAQYFDGITFERKAIAENIKVG